MTKKPTQMVIKSSAPSAEQKAQLEARAARFKLTTAPVSGATKTGPISTVTDPAEAERLAARAARFADIKTGPALTTTGKVSTSTSMRTTLSSEEAEKLALRASRFSGIPSDLQTTASSRRRKH